VTDTARLRELAGKLVAWLQKRGQPDSGMRYEGQSYDLATGRTIASRVELHGTDADFIAKHFHGQGARELSTAILSLLDELDASKARIAEVKPLEWGGNGIDVFYTTSVLGTYTVKHDGDEPEEWSYNLGNRMLGSARDESEAKAAAQEHHDKRILSALASHTVDTREADR
jgi:hypothetical protein